LAGVAAPLNLLRKKGAKFVWEEAQQKAFDTLKMAIANPPALRMADFSKTFILQMDASCVALGAVLSQEIDGCRQPIAYASRTLSTQDRRASSAYELECLAVLFGTEKLRPYLEHCEFLLETETVFWTGESRVGGENSVTGLWIYLVIRVFLHIECFSRMVRNVKMCMD
jgi:hypothetical protein